MVGLRGAALLRATVVPFCVTTFSRSVRISALCTPNNQSKDAMPKTISGYSISPAISATSVFIVLSYIGLAVAPTKYVFATLSNVCYLSAGFYRELASLTKQHSAAQLVGQLGGGSLVLVLIGASSFAYHRETMLSSPAHTLDILFGWVLVSHVLYVCFSVSSLGLLRQLLPEHLDDIGLQLLRATLSLCMLVTFVFLMAFYNTIYRNQELLYFTLGPAAALAGGACRFLLVRSEGALSWHAVAIAVVEVVVVESTYCALNPQS